MVLAGDPELASDPIVRVAFDDETDHVALALRQRAPAAGHRLELDHLGVEGESNGGHPLDAREQDLGGTGLQEEASRAEMAGSIDVLGRAERGEDDPGGGRLAIDEIETGAIGQADIDHGHTGCELL